MFARYCARKAATANTLESSGLLESLAATSGSSSIPLSSHLESAGVDGDANHLEQVLNNLLVNGITYNREGGELRVATAMEGAWAILTVADAGPGISEEDLPGLFERFYRADKSRSRAEGNSGLGLAICRAIVQAHGGEITASSQVGTGSTFTVRLPRPADQCVIT